MKEQHRGREEWRMFYESCWADHCVSSWRVSCGSGEGVVTDVGQVAK